MSNKRFKRQDLAAHVAQNSIAGLISDKKREDLYSVFFDLNTKGQSSWTATVWPEHNISEIPKVDLLEELEKQKRFIDEINHRRAKAFLCLAYVLHSYIEAESNRSDKRFIPEAGRKTGLVQAERSWLIDGYYSRAFDQNRIATIKVTDLI